jgi:hypothetical protein
MWPRIDIISQRRSILYELRKDDVC